MVDSVAFGAYTPQARSSSNPDVFNGEVRRARTEQSRLTIPEQKDAQAWQEIDRQRGLGKTYDQIFQDAVRGGDLEVAGAIIRKPPQGFDINKKDADGQTVLFKALSSSSPRAMVELLVNEGRIDLAVVNEGKLSAYLLAVLNYNVAVATGTPNSGELKGIADFLKQKLDSEAVTAQRNGFEARAGDLVAAGAERPDPKKVAADIQKEFFEAVAAGDIKKVRSFLEKPPQGFDINAKDANNETALFKALSSANPREMVELLVNEGRIDLAVVNEGKLSAYHLAVLNYNVALTTGAPNSGELKGIADFLKQKLDSEAVTAQRDGFKARAGDLVAAGAERPDPKKVAADIQKEFFEAVAAGDIKKIRSFIEKPPQGFDINAQNENGQTVLHIALGGGVKGNVREIVNLLLENKADPTILDNDGRGALQVGYRAIEDGKGGDRDAVQELRKKMDERAKAAYDKGDRQAYDALVRAGAGSLGEAPKNGNPPTRDTKRPPGDTRSAQEIIKDSPLLANLSADDKRFLKEGKNFRKQYDGHNISFEGVGDFENDADAAYRAVAVLEHIERYSNNDSEAFGQSGVVGNGKLDGWNGSHANSRGQNTAADARPHTEAGRFQDFLKNGWGQLETYNVNVKHEADGKKTVGDLQTQAYERIIKAANLPENRRDIIEHPEKYTVEQRYAAQLELMLAGERLSKDTDKYYDEKGAVLDGRERDPKRNGMDKDEKWRLNKDPNNVLKSIQDAITRLDSPEVREYGSKQFAKEVQSILAADPKRRAEVEALYIDMKNNAVGLGQFVGKDKNTLDGMRSYLNQVQSLRDALGKDGEPLDDNFTIDIRNSPQFDAITDAYSKEFRDPETLTRLVDQYKKEGKTQEQAEQMAFAEFNSRTVLFSNFGSPQSEIRSVVNENIQHYMLNSATTGDLEKSPLFKNGELDEQFLRNTLEELQARDPGNGIFRTPDGSVLSVGQIVVAVKGAWDGLRNLNKINAAIPKADVGMKQLLNPDGAFQKKLFGSGTMHAVSTVFSAAIIGARIGTSNGDVSPSLTAATVGTGIQMLGIGIQAFEFSKRPHPKVEWGNLFRVGSNMTPPTTTVKPTLMNSGKILNGVGGLINGAASIAIGVEELRKGNKGAAGVWLTLGISNTATALGPLAEAGQAISYALRPLTAATAANRAAQLLGRTTNAARLFVIGGSISMGLNVVAALGVIAGAIYGAVAEDKYEKKQQKYFDQFSPTLFKYGITGGDFKQAPIGNNSNPRGGSGTSGIY